MKTLFAILALFMAAGATYSQTNATSYDWQAHWDRIDVQFSTYVPMVLKSEREKMEAILPQDKVDQYMKWFESGLNSNTGAVMLEGGDSQWLEIACRAGYAQKTLFRRGYFDGLTRKAEIDE